MKLFNFSIRFFSTKQKRVTFIGLGNMGYSMARNLSKVTEFKVTGYDINQDVQANFNKEIQNQNFPSLEDSLANSEFVLTMLPNSQTVSANWEKCYKTSKKGTYLID